MEPYTGGASFWLDPSPGGPPLRCSSCHGRRTRTQGQTCGFSKQTCGFSRFGDLDKKRQSTMATSSETNEFAPFCSTRFSSPRQLLSRTTCRNQTQDPSSKSRPRTHTARPMFLCTQVACESVRLAFTQTAPRRTVPRSMPARGRREAILGEAETQQIHGLSEGHQMLQQACCATASFTWRLSTPNCFQTAQNQFRKQCAQTWSSMRRRGSGRA